jgi:outer membrane lipoprotein-sorting protein
MTIILKTLFFISFYSSIALASSFTDSPWIDRIHAYFKSLESIKADISQINPDKSENTGHVYWDRKVQKIKVNYQDNKISLYLDAEHYLVFDHVERTVQAFDMKDTPVSLLLRKDINLRDHRLKIHHIHETEDHLTITIKQFNDDRVTLTLRFSKHPTLQLEGWTILDIQGNTTIIRLKNTRINVSIPKDTYILPDYKPLG